MSLEQEDPFDEYPPAKCMETPTGYIHRAYLGDERCGCGATVAPEVRRPPMRQRGPFKKRNELADCEPVCLACEVEREEILELFGVMSKASVIIAQGFEDIASAVRRARKYLPNKEDT